MLPGDKSSYYVQLYKKRRHERFAVRAGRPVTQTTPSFEGGSDPSLIAGISTRYYRFRKKQIPKLIFLYGALLQPFAFCAASKTRRLDWERANSRSKPIMGGAEASCRIPAQPK